MPVALIADAHLSGPGGRAGPLVRQLAELPAQDCDRLVLMGDLLSTFICPHCGEATDIFKKEGGRKTADLLGTAFLGAVPLDPKIVLGGDAGVPIVVSEPQGPHADAFRHVAEEVVEEVERQEAVKPKLSIV